MVTVGLVYETHSITEDNERGIATGWLPGRLSERWGLDHLIAGIPLEDLVAADFAWQEGWEYLLP
jgi:hypothetical protein